MATVRRSRSRHRHTSVTPCPVFDGEHIGTLAPVILSITDNATPEDAGPMMMSTFLCQQLIDSLAGDHLVGAGVLTDQRDFPSAGFDLGLCHEHSLDERVFDHRECTRLRQHPPDLQLAVGPFHPCPRRTLRHTRASASSSADQVFQLSSHGFQALPSGLESNARFEARESIQIATAMSGQVSGDRRAANWYVEPIGAF